MAFKRSGVRFSYAPQKRHRYSSDAFFVGASSSNPLSLRDIPLPGGMPGSAEFCSADPGRLRCFDVLRHLADAPARRLMAPSRLRRSTSGIRKKICMAETCGRPRPHEREGPTSEAQWEGRAVEDCEGFQTNYTFRRTQAKKQAAPFPKSAAPVYKTNLTNRRESLRGPCAKVRQFFSCAKRFKQNTPFLQS